MRRLSFLLLLLATSLTSLAGNTERVLLYPSIDQHGDSLMLSGKLSIPTNRPKGVILIPHYTITSKHQAPSVKMTDEAPYFKDDYVLVMPDYIGYGVTENMEHPYLAGELTAHNCIDMLIGAKPILDSMNIPMDSLYIVGYSQGGASALWALKVLEEKFADRFSVIACYAGGGPYDVAVTYDDAIQRKKVFMPVVIPMLIVGTDVAYDLHLDREKFFTPAMLKIYRDYLSNKEYSTTQLFFKVANHRLSHWMTKEAMDPTNAEVLPMYEGLKRSSLVRYPLNEKVPDRQIICPEWRPKAKLYIFHSSKDNVVTIHCAEHLQRCLQDMPNITYDFGNYGSHIKASGRFFKKVKAMMP